MTNKKLRKWIFRNRNGLTALTIGIACFFAGAAITYICCQD